VVIKWLLSGDKQKKLHWKKTQRFIQNIAKNVKTTRVTRIFAKVLIACRATTFGKVDCSNSQLLLEYVV